VNAGSDIMKPVARLCAFMLIATLVALPDLARAAVDPTSDTAVKAAFLYNFAKFTEWPASAKPLTMCIVGDIPIANELVETVRDKRLDGRALEVKGIGSDASMLGCDVLFIASSEARRAAAVLQSLRTLRILTVSDCPGFARAGGIIELVVESERIHFAINTDAATRAGVRLSSRLLGLARIVRDEHVY
jgi:hypothetical protein